MNRAREIEQGTYIGEYIETFIYSFFRKLKMREVHNFENPK